MKNKKILIGAGVAVVLILAIIFGTTAEDDRTAEEIINDATSAPAAPETTEAAPEPEPTASDEPEEEPAEKYDGKAYAAKVEQSLKDALGVDSFQDACDRGSWACALVGVESPSAGTIVLRFQVEAEGDELEDATKAAFNLVGREYPDLTVVQGIDVTGSSETVRRDELPMLN